MSCDAETNATHSANAPSRKSDSPGDVSAMPHSPARPACTRRLRAGLVASGAAVAALVAAAVTAVPASATVVPGAGQRPGAAVLVADDRNDDKGKGRGKGKGGIDTAKLTFGVQPAGPRAVDPRPLLDYKNVKPGQRLFDHVGIVNISTRPITVSFYAADGFTTPEGGFDVLRQDQRSRDLGSWVTLRRNQVTVPARSTFITPIELNVPRSAEPGDHAAAIVASLRTYVKDKNGNIVAQDARTGTRLYVRVTGTLKPGLRVERKNASFSPAIMRGKADVTYTVKNTGNVRLVGKQSLRVSGLFGLAADAGDVPDLPELLPGAEVTLTQPVRGVIGTLFNTVRLTIDPQSVSGNVDPAVAQVSATSRLTAVSWLPVGLAVFLLVLLAAAVVRFRRRSRPAPRDPWGPAGGNPGIGSGDPAPPPLGERPRAGITRRAATAVAALVAGVLVAVVPGASPAAAADGTLTFLPGKGTAATPVYAVTSGGCPKQGTNIIGFMYGSGMPAEGAVIMSNQSAPVRHDGAFGFGLRDNLQSIAAEVGATLKGRYKLVVQCTDQFGLEVFASFTGTVTFTDPKSFTAPVPTKPPLGQGVPPGYLALVFPEFKKVVEQDFAAAKADNQEALAQKASGTASPPAQAAAQPAAAPAAARSGPGPLGELGWSPLAVLFGLVVLAAVLWVWTRQPSAADAGGRRTTGSGPVLWPDGDGAPPSRRTPTTRR